MKVYKEHITEDGYYDVEFKLSKEDWKEILQNPYFESYLDIIIKFYEEKDNRSTCKNLSEKFGKDSQYYNAKVTAFTKAVQKYLNRFQIVNLAGNPTYWLIAMKGKKLENGFFEWTLREELVEAIEELNLNTQVNTYFRFKKLLEYFVAHLDYLVNERENTLGYEHYIKPLVEKGTFKRTGQGYTGAAIQKQISNWENYDSGKICINVQPNYGDYRTVKCYLNWIDTGINIVIKWNGKTISGLYLDEFIYWENPTRRVDLNCAFTLEELGLYQTGIIKQELKIFFVNFVNAHERIKNIKLKKKRMAPILEIMSILEYKKQIILQGPPGTGKTRLAKWIAQELVGLENLNDLEKSHQFKIIQFHPSYSYEDFVRGIVAESKGNSIEYKNVNKTLGQFAEDALKNYWDSKKDIQTITTEIKVKEAFDRFKEYINDKIEESSGFFKLTENVGLITTDDEEAFRYKGANDGWLRNGNRMLFRDIIQAFNDGNFERQDLKKNPFVSGLARQHASYFIRVVNLFQEFIEREKIEIYSESSPQKVDLKNYVLIIDEINRANLSSVLGELIYALEYRGEPVDSMYSVESSSLLDKNKIILPPNLYIIGTMNTADRSVGHIDYAIRRRFAFVEVLPEDLTNELGPASFYSDLFHMVKSLFTSDDYQTRSSYLEIDFEPKDVALGHSYFIDKSKEGADLKMRWKFEIKPILLEYIRDGVLKETALNKIIEIEKSL